MCVADVIEYFIHITEDEFSSYILTQDSVILIAYSDDVTEHIVSESQYNYTIAGGTITPISLKTNRSTGAIGAQGNYSYEMTFKSGPINLGSQVSTSGESWCNRFCCPACEKTHEIFGLEILDPICCFYCTICHCC